MLEKQGKNMEKKQYDIDCIPKNSTKYSKKIAKYYAQQMSKTLIAEV